MVLLGVVDDRALEVGGEDVAHDADGEVGLLEDDRRAPCVSLTRLLQHLVELEQVLQLALEVRARGAVRRGADDRAAAAEVELLGLRGAGGRAPRPRAGARRRRPRRSGA